MSWTGAIAAALVITPAYAASEDAKSTPPEEKAVGKSVPKKDRAPKEASDTDSCRQDAQGLHGPERGRFMTNCLKTRR